MNLDFVRAAASILMSRPVALFPIPAFDAIDAPSRTLFSACAQPRDMTAFGRRVKVHGADRVNRGLEWPLKARIEVAKSTLLQGI